MIDKAKVLETLGNIASQNCQSSGVGTPRWRVLEGGFGMAGM
jgi:hypothetical protein